jgi:predicted nucleic acid-binding Zn ribbon protein
VSTKEPEDRPDEDEPAAQPDPAADALRRARASARGRGVTPAAPSRGGKGAAGRRPAREPFTAAGRDPYDPQRVGDVVRDLTAERGWDTDLAIGAISGRWAEIVGEEIAAHAQPERFEDGELVLVAESSAWATQLRLLRGSLDTRLRAVLGPGIVRRITVRGPTSPSWSRGRWRVAGRGPRDTYG